MDKLIAEKKSYMEIIKTARQNIADLRKQKVEKKAPLWEVAQGTVDAKKDYIRSMVADIERNIAHEEANIEYCYNMIDIINDKMVYSDG